MQFFIAPMPQTVPCALRRLFDILTMLVVGLMVLPLVLGIACVIRLTSGGPVLFRQQRVGQGGRLFTIYKFRSLRVGPHDPHRPQAYTTRIGAFLRRYGLDELPQLYNILKGDMTFIGPRPILPAEMLGYEAWQRQRLLIRPGLTGWAQVNGRNALPWYDRVALDVWYVQHRSISLDLRILWRTPRTLLRGTGVYGPGNQDPGYPVLASPAGSASRPRSSVPDERLVVAACAVYPSLQVSA